VKCCNDNFFIVWLVEFPLNGLQIEVAPFCLSFEEVTMRVCHKVLTEMKYILPIVGDPQGILSQQLRPD
jgi:hypothetical protein